MQEDGTEANKIMGIKDGLRNIRWVTLVKFASMALFGAWSLGFAWVLLAQPAGQKTFSSPDEASKALIRAVQAGNEESLLEIFGTDGKEIISSGDKVEDQKSRDLFAEKYQRMNRLVEEPDGTIRLYVGAENWPMPIPLVNRKDAWYFDTSAGKEETGHYVPCRGTAVMGEDHGDSNHTGDDERDSDVQHGIAQRPLLECTQP